MVVDGIRIHLDDLRMQKTAKEISLGMTIDHQKRN